jgi:hypothetical protein
VARPSWPWSHGLEARAIPPRPQNHLSGLTPTFSRARIHRPPSASAHLHGLSLYSNLGNFRISACLCPRGTDVMHILHYRTRKSQGNSPPELKVSGGYAAKPPPLKPRRPPLAFAARRFNPVSGQGVEAGRRCSYRGQPRPRPHRCCQTPRRSLSAPLCTLCGNLFFVFSEPLRGPLVFCLESGVLCLYAIFSKKFAEFPLTFRPLFWPGNEGAQKAPKNHQFPPSFCRKVTKKLQNAHKIINISKSLCHHLKPLSQKHLVPFFSESPISPRVHYQPPKSSFSAQKSSFARP